MSGTEDSNEQLTESVFQNIDKQKIFSWNDKWMIAIVLFFLALIAIAFIYGIYAEINSLISSTAYSNTQIVWILIQRKYIFFLIFPILIICSIAIKRTIGWIMSVINFYFFIILIIIAETQNKTGQRSILIELLVISIAILNILLLHSPALKKFYKLNKRSIFLKTLFAFLTALSLAVFLRFF